MESRCGFDLYFPDSSDVEHLFIDLLIIFICSLKKGLSKSSAHFKPDYLFLRFVFSLLSCMNH